MSDKELRLQVRAVVLLILVMLALAMLGEVSRQNWNGKVTAYPTKTEEAMMQYARDLVSRMTPAELAGQLFYAADGPDAETAAQLHLGGVLITVEQLDRLTKADVQAVLRGYEAADTLPMLVGVAEEGGTAVTVSCHEALRPISFLTPRELMTMGGLQLVDSDTREKSSYLLELGFHMNFAPYCYAVADEEDPCYARSVSGSGEEVSRYVQTVVKAMGEQGMIACAVAFPGDGSLTEESMLPFRKAVEAGLPMMLMDGVSVLDREQVTPGCLSQGLHAMLRSEYGFEGVIVADLREESFGEDTEGLGALAIRAGSDMVLTEDCESQIDGVLKAMRAGQISRERLEESAQRVVMLKLSYGLTA